MLRREDLVCLGQSVDEKGVAHYRLAHTAAGGACPACGSEKSCVNDRAGRAVVSVGPKGEKVVFDIVVTRYKCGRCGKTWYPPLVEGGGLCTDIFKTVLAEEILYGGRTLEEAAEIWDVPVSMVRKSLGWHLDDRAGKMACGLPEEIVLAPARIRNRRMAFVVDPAMLLLVGAVPAGELGRMPGAESVRRVVLMSPELLGEAEEAFPDAQTAFEPAGLAASGAGVLLGEGERAGLDRKTLARYLETGDGDLLMELVCQSVKVLPIKRAWDFLMENAGDIAVLKTYSGELDGFRKFAGSLKEGESGLPKGEGEYIAEMAGVLAEEAGHYAGLDLPGAMVAKLLLVNEHSVYPVKGHSSRGSGRRLKRRLPRFGPSGPDGAKKGGDKTTPGF